MYTLCMHISDKNMHVLLISVYIHAWFPLVITLMSVAIAIM